MHTYRNAGLVFWTFTMIFCPARQERLWRSWYANPELTLRKPSRTLVVSHQVTRLTKNASLQHCRRSIGRSDLDPVSTPRGLIARHSCQDKPEFGGRVCHLFQTSFPPNGSKAELQPSFQTLSRALRASCRTSTPSGFSHRVAFAFDIGLPGSAASATTTTVHSASV